MKFISISLLRFFSLSLITGFLFLMAGGPLYTLNQPFEIGLIVAYFVMLPLFSYLLNKSSKNFWQRFERAGWAAFVLSMIVPPMLGIIHTAGMLDQGLQVTGNSLAASLVGLIYPPIIYFSFFYGASDSNSP